MSANGWFEAQDPVLPAAQLPAALLDLAAQRGAAPDRLLAGTRLFYAELVRAGRPVAASQLERMLGNARRLGLGDDFSFRLGHLAWPTAFGSAAAALGSAPDVHAAVRTLVRERALYAPFVHLRAVRTEEGLWVLCTDGIGWGASWPAVVEFLFGAFVATVRGLAARRPEWTFLFEYGAPARPEQYHENLGPRLSFGAPVTAFLVPAGELGRPLRGASRTAFRLALAQCARERALRDPGPGFLEAVYLRVLGRERMILGQEAVAATFAMSPATLKRRLRAHGERYQTVVDRACLHATLYQLLLRGRGTEAVAARLGFSDPANFRRAFRRWTGDGPRELVARLRGQGVPVLR